MQANPKLLASICGGYIEFLLLGMEDKNFLQSVRTVLKEKRDAPKVYQGISNAENLNENRCMLEMAECLTESYFHFLGMQETFLNEFYQYARKSIHEVIDATFYLLGGGQMVFLKAIERVLLKANVRKAYYQENFGRYTAIMYQQRYFWIEDYGKSMIKNEDEKHYDYEERLYMTGTLITKQNASGQSYYYIKLSYKDPISHKWRQKMISTHLEVKGNKRRAETMKNEAIANYSYLEMLPEEYNANIDPDITLCDYLANWLHRKKNELERSTYESYEYRASQIHAYFKVTNPKLRDVTAGMVDKFITYLLQYGKTNQKTAEKDPLAVRTVRSIKSILLSVYNQAAIDA